MYSLAVKHLFPEYSDRASEFLFLKFELDDSKNSGIIRMAPITDDDLEGFEHQLTAIQEYLDNFSEEDAYSNFASKQPFPKDKTFSGPLQCGFAKYPGQLKIDGTPMWACSCKWAFDYFSTVDENGKQLKSYFNESDIPEGQKYEKRSYKGCPAHQKKS
jgi:hypothetical protein